MRHEAIERVVDVAYLAKESKGREKFLDVGMKRKNVGSRESFNASLAKGLDIYKKIVERKWNKQIW